MLSLFGVLGKPCADESCPRSRSGHRAPLEAPCTSVRGTVPLQVPSLFAVPGFYCQSQLWGSAGPAQCGSRPRARPTRRLLLARFSPSTCLSLFFPLFQSFSCQRRDPPSVCSSLGIPFLFPSSFFFFPFLTTVTHLEIISLRSPTTPFRVFHLFFSVATVGRGLLILANAASYILIPSLHHQTTLLPFSLSTSLPR